MRVDLFDFDLPPELIAQHPVRPRDAARLLVVRAEALEDRRVRDLPALLRPGDLLVFNDTRVIPARLLGSRGGAKIEVTLHQPLEGAAALADAAEPAGAHAVTAGPGALWRAFARPARRCRVGDRLRFGGDFEAEVLAKGEAGEITLAFGCAPGRCSSGSRAAATCRCRPTSGVRPRAMRRTARTIRPCSPRVPAPLPRPRQRSTSRRA